MTWYVWWWYLLVSKEARCLLQSGAVCHLQLDAGWSSRTFERNDHDSVWLGCHYKTVGSWEKGQLITACPFVHTLWSFGVYLNCCHWMCWNLELSWISDSHCLHTKQLYFLLPVTVFLFLFQQERLCLVVQFHCGLIWSILALLYCFCYHYNWSWL